ncbi:MAG TPA: methyltransferase domain-containing protein [Phycisphaerae bacterium]|nr:methyltransferase domain-containing protein [Phycisphaerae bacterium]
MNGSLPDSPAPRNADHLIDLLRTLADPIRLRIIRLLEGPVQSPASSSTKSPPDPDAPTALSVGELAEALKLPQSTLSRHLKTLLDAHLAEARREGTSMLYRLAPAANDPPGKQLRDLARAHLEHDPLAKSDAHRLAAILRRRQPPSAADSFFGKHAPEWDSLRSHWFGDRFHLEALLALLNPEWTVADVGTGTGAMLPLLSPHIKNIIAIDPSPAMLKAARHRVRTLNLPNIDLRPGSAENLPLDNASVDVLLHALVLVYTPDPPAVHTEARRTLKPGGTILIIDLQPHTLEPLRQKLEHRWLGFPQPQLESWLAAARFSHPRWHPLSPPAKPPKDTPHPPDLFALRATASP